MSKKFTLLAALLCGAVSVLAQTNVIKGKIIDKQDNSALGGVTVRILGTATGTVTDVDGAFSLNAAKDATLEVSFIGYLTKRVKATPGSPMSIPLEIDAKGLQEVVVTAGGITRTKKALGYAVATVKSKDLELRPEGDVVRLLNGKAPGVDIQNTSGMSGSGTNIVIRGVSTISGSATPLFVVDGVPFDGSTNAPAGFTYGNATSSRFLDLDPNNIENISVLKGFSATTLYGELGRNGVVLITTRNGSSRPTKKKMEVTVSQSVFANKVANLPEYQDTYGAGFDQSVGLVFFSNWGGKFTDPALEVAHPYDRSALNTAFPEYVGAKYQYKPYNSVERFFRTGVVKTTSVNMASSGANSSFNANYSYMDDQGFTPGNSLYKNTFGLGGTAKLSNHITVSGTFNYATTNLKSPPTSTSFGSNPSVSSIFGNLLYTPRSVDLFGLPYENPLDHSSVYYRSSNDIQHPLWTLNNSFTGEKVNRVFGNFQVKYDILKDLSISYRVGIDNYSSFNFLSQNKGGTAGGSQYTLGIHRTIDAHKTLWDHTILLNWQKEISSDWSLNLDAGVNSLERKYEQSGMKSTQQLVYGLFDHDNFVSHENTAEDGIGLDYKENIQSIGVFAQGILSYKEYVYLNLGGRNSWTSNMEKANRSLFYPSVSVAFIPTSAIEALRNSDVVNYLKIRAGYATSANFGDPYKTRPTLSINTNVFVDKTGTVINTNSIGNRLANPDLKPELLREVEVGVEGTFFNNRVNLDLTLYRRVAKDQILDRDLDPSSGYTVTAMNAGSVRNKGIELGLGYTVIRNRNWRWQLDGNFTLNRSMISDLPEGIQIVIDGFSNEGLFAMNGQPLGVIQGSHTVKDSATGQRIVNANGDYVSSSDLAILGDPTPDYKLSGISTLSYKGFSLRVQVDYTKGGDMLAYTPGTLIGRGLTKDTDFDRTLPIILPGVKEDSKTPNDIQISTSRAYFNNLSGFFGMQDLITYDATVIRLREASLSYSLPENILHRTPFGAVSLTITGQNLWYNAPHFPRYTNFDPEVSSLGVSNVRGLEYLAGPTSRRYGASLRVTF